MTHLLATRAGCQEASRVLPQSCCPLLSSKSEVTGGMGAHSHHSGCISGHSSDCPVQNLPYTRCPQRHIGLKYPQWLCVQGGKAVSDQRPQGAEVCSWHSLVSWLWLWLKGQTWRPWGCGSQGQEGSVYSPVCIVHGSRAGTSPCLPCACSRHDQTALRHVLSSHWGYTWE